MAVSCVERPNSDPATRLKFRSVFIESSINPASFPAKRSKFKWAPRGIGARVSKCLNGDHGPCTRSSLCCPTLETVRKVNPQLRSRALRSALQPWHGTTRQLMVDVDVLDTGALATLPTYHITKTRGSKWVSWITLFLVSHRICWREGHP